jgi:hypothetical protein
MLNVIFSYCMLNDVMLSVVFSYCYMLNVVFSYCYMLNVVFSYCYAKLHYAECRFDECRGAILFIVARLKELRRAPTSARIRFVKPYLRHGE